MAELFLDCHVYQINCKSKKKKKDRKIILVRTTVKIPPVIHPPQATSDYLRISIWSGKIRETFSVRREEVPQTFNFTSSAGAGKEPIKTKCIWRMFSFFPSHEIKHNSLRSCNLLYPSVGRCLAMISIYYWHKCWNIHLHHPSGTEKGTKDIRKPWQESFKMIVSVALTFIPCFEPLTFIWTHQFTILSILLIYILYDSKPKSLHEPLISVIYCTFK